MEKFVDGGVGERLPLVEFLNCCNALEMLEALWGWLVVIVVEGLLGLGHEGRPLMVTRAGVDDALYVLACQTKANYVLELQELKYV